MNRLLKISSITGSACVPMAARCGRGAHAREHEVIERRDLRLPLRLDDGRGVGFGDDGRSGDGVAGAQRLAAVDRGVVEGAAAEHAHRPGDPRPRRPGAAAGRCASSTDSPGRGRLDRHGLDHEGAPGHEKAELLPVARFEAAPASPPACRSPPARRYRCLRSAGARARATWIVFPRHALARHRLRALRLRAARPSSSSRGRTAGSSRASTACAAHRGDVGEPHAVGGEHAGVGMDEDPRDGERVGDQAGVLAGGAAEAAQRIARSRRGRAPPRSS